MLAICAQTIIVTSAMARTADALRIYFLRQRQFGITPKYFQPAVERPTRNLLSQDLSLPRKVRVTLHGIRLTGNRGLENRSVEDFIARRSAARGFGDCPLDSEPNVVVAGSRR